MHPHTLAQYNECIKTCREVFVQKTKDYGTAWRILRLSSITDQLMMKAQRIRAIQEKGTQLVQDGIATELIGIVNYGIIALIQATLKDNAPLALPCSELVPLYDAVVKAALALCSDKNHDYQDSWRGMRISSLTDIILMKLLRIKNIEDNQGQTLISEGVEANYQDIINYAIFALIKQQAS